MSVAGRGGGTSSDAACAADVVSRAVIHGGRAPSVPRGRTRVVLRILGNRGVVRYAASANASAHLARSVLRIRRFRGRYPRCGRSVWSVLLWVTHDGSVCGARRNSPRLAGPRRGRPWGAAGG